MKILSLWPPQVPSYFNAGHHLPVFLNAAYLREQGHEVTAIDAGALNMDWKHLADTIYQGRFDLVAIVKVREHEQLADVIAGRLSKVEGVVATDTHIAFRSYSKADTDAAFAIGLD